MAVSTIADDKKKALNLAIAQIEKSCGKGSIMRMDEKEKVRVEAVPTGAINLDAAIGVGGIPRGRVTEIYGPESSGKTTLCLHVVANAQKMGGVAAFIDEDAAPQRVLGEQVVSGDDHMRAAHHEDHRRETRQRERVLRHPCLPEPTVAGGCVGVQILGHPVGIDDRDEPIDERDEVEREDRADQLQERAEELELTHPDHDPAGQRDEQDRGRGEQQGARRRTGIRVAQAGEDQGQECRRERRPGARSRLLRVLHRA